MAANRTHIKTCPSQQRLAGTASNKYNTNVPRNTQKKITTNLLSVLVINAFFSHIIFHGAHLWPGHGSFLRRARFARACGHTGTRALGHYAYSSTAQCSLSKARCLCACHVSPRRLGETFLFYCN